MRRRRPGLLLLLHGLGATGEVWRPVAAVLDREWSGRYVAPDLPGHGRTAALPRYSFGALAAAVAAGIEPGEAVVVLGHSLGGVVGLALASGWYGVDVTGVVGISIKVAWTDAELAKAQALAARPVSWFDTYAEAAQRHLVVSGLIAAARAPVVLARGERDPMVSDSDLEALRARELRPSSTPATTRRSSGPSMSSRC